MQGVPREVMLEIRSKVLAGKKKNKVVDILPGEFTAKKYAEDNGVSESTARRELRAALEAELVTVRPSKHVGNLKYYKYVKEEGGD